MRVVLIGFYLSSAFLAVGCKQGNGDRCVQDSDCSSGLCSSHTVQGGQCISSTTTQTGNNGTGGQSGAAGEAGQGGGGAGGEGGAVGQDAAPASDAAHDAPTSG